ncbi:MAG: efflux RND transporter periplasmic adaptor subunit, partial [Hyphomicrobiaceae bacterium]|nr:efflux RND transporter periplasmic adaptor subunit [Hyphomicrobiaceae bacterium]
MVMIKRFLIAGIIIAVFLGGVGWFNLIFKPKTIADFVATMAPPAITITVEPAKLESWTDRLHSIGTLIAIEGVEVASEVGGIVSGIYFESGEDVKKGDKLVQLDVSVEEAELHSQEALLREANLHQERQTRLVKRNVTSPATLETATAKHESAIASLERIEALIAQKTIVAPFSGQLGLRRVDKGQYVSSGQTRVWLQAVDPIWVDFPVPEGEVGDFKVGAKIELTVDTYEDRVFEGEVEAFDARLNKDSRTLMVRGTFKNSDRKLIPGMFAEVAVLAGEPKELVTVPRTALTYSLYGDSVWVVKSGAPEPAATPTPTASSEPVASAEAADATPTGAIPPAP